MTYLCLSSRNVFVIYDDGLQAVPNLNGTSFDFVTIENGPVCLDLYATPQYKMDQPSVGTGELFTLYSLLFNFPYKVHTEWCENGVGLLQKL